VTRRLGSTYRLQLNGLGFAAAERMVPFLRELGVETCYVSPVTRARAGSTHGYDVIDPTVLDPALGTREEFESLLAALAAHDMGLLVDIVPNHMAASTENPFFADVLQHGEDSEFASYFDIAWEEQAGKILLPVLGRPLAEALQAGEIQLLDGDPSRPPSIGYFEHRYPVAPDSLDGGAQSIESVLSRQHYRLADWRVANQEINYRRFFDINELIGVRQEDPAVFEATHRLVAELVADQRIVGVRVDHVDGLRDPAGYLDSLRELCGQGGAAPAIVIEKILAADEVLPDWPVAGTTGYEFGAMLVGLFVDATGAADLARATSQATGDDRSFDDRATSAKRAATELLFPHQLDQVTARFVRAVDSAIAAGDLAAAIAELTACLEVYRTYRVAGTTTSAADLQRVQAAAERARGGLSEGAAAALDRVVELLISDLELAGPAEAAVGAWQQFTSPVTAKGVEDTAMYRSGRLLAAADVGGEPDRPAVSVAEFHAAMTRRVEHSSGALSATSTHDSKRSHDVRCRLAVLSEVAGEWETTVQALESALFASTAASAPDVADRRFVYETLVGAWPIGGDAGEGFAERMRDYVVKAAREAKRHTSWLDPDAGYEAALQQLADRIILGEPRAARELVEQAVASVERAGVVNSLASVLIKTTAPGVPDTYQNDDAWLFALVDPDNRAPVDLPRHVELLSHPRLDEPLDDWRSGAVKQLVLRRALAVRRGAAHRYDVGGYQPVEVIGERSDHVIAFVRFGDAGSTLTVAPRLVRGFAGADRFPLGPECWTDTELVLPSGYASEFVDVLTDRPLNAVNGRLPLAEVLATLPVALLSSA
jgi:(1->4)-alpha-D-glucan 1-alpha-D-glucosylmutase